MCAVARLLRLLGVVSESGRLRQRTGGLREAPQRANVAYALSANDTLRNDTCASATTWLVAVVDHLDVLGAGDPVRDLLRISQEHLHLLRRRLHGELVLEDHRR
jgi:hypothetical protein